MPTYDLASLVKINNQNLADIKVTDLLQAAPLFAALEWTVASNGTKHQYLVEDGAPSCGFRNINEGLPRQASTDRLVERDLRFLDASWDCDIAAAKAYNKGVDAFIEYYTPRSLSKAFAKAEHAIINGDSTESFLGFADAVDELTDEMIVNAGGSEGTESNLTSVYFIRCVPDLSGVVGVMGNEGNIEVEATYMTTALDIDGDPYDAYRTPVNGWLGLQPGSIHDIGRICNIDTAVEYSTEIGGYVDSEFGLTDSLLSFMLEKFPASNMPTHIIMNRKARGQLQRSRQTYSPTGAPAPVPSDYEGIAIVCTDHINSNETAVA